MKKKIMGVIDVYKRQSVDGEASGAGLCKKTVFKKSREDFKKRAFVRKTL